VSTEPGPAAHDQVVAAVLRASRALVGVSSRSLAEVEDALTMTQFRTLVVLDEGPVGLAPLAARLGVAPSTALRTVERLLTADLATRTENARDRRQVVIAASEEGQRVVRAVTERRREEIARVVARMDAPAGDLVAAFDAFADAVDLPEAGTPTVLGW